MIFVVLGTQDKSFERLLKAIDEQIEMKNIKEKVIVQAGSTKYKSKNMKILDLIPIKDFNSYIKKSKYIISHGGVGTILDAIKMKKKVKLVPRLKEYGEHEKKHQIEITDEFAKGGYIIPCKDLNNLGSAIEKIEKFKPKEYVGDNTKMINVITNYIDSCR